MRAPSNTHARRHPVGWSRIQALGLMLLLVAAIVPYERSARRFRRLQDDRRVERLTRVLRASPRVWATLQPLPCQRSSDQSRVYKLSLVETGLETVTRIEYVETGVRVSKGCYTFRMRPVFVLEPISPRVHTLAEPHPHPDLWSEVVRAGKLGPVVLVRLGEPLPYAHEVVPLVGAWNIYGTIRGASFDQRHLTTLLNPDTINSSRLAWYAGRGMMSCRRWP